VTQHEDEFYYDDEEDAPRSRALGIASILAAVLAGVGFIWLAWHAYESGSATYDPDDAELVQADNTPYKEVPKDPGGWQAPHRDKTIYEVIERGNGNAQASVAERLTASPEEPMEVAAAKDKPAEKGAGAWMNSKLRDDASEVPMTEAERQKVQREETKSAPAEAAEKKPEPAAATPAPVVEKQPEPVKAEPVKEVAQKPVEAKPAPVEEKPAPVKVQEAPKQTASTPASAAPAAGGKGKIQLGAFRNEGDAAAHVKHVNSRVPGVLTGKNITVERADLGEKGIYYRLFALGFADKAAAGDACTKLKAARLDCMVK
jgi:chemotaxis protein histidine kinase CheA